MKTRILVMAMTIIGALSGCAAHGGETVEEGCDVFKTKGGTTVKM